MAVRSAESVRWTVRDGKVAAREPQIWSQRRFAIDAFRPCRLECAGLWPLERRWKMRGTHSRRGVHLRRAATIVYVTVSLVVVFGMGALAVDVGTLYLARGELQRAADAAALAAAAELVSADPSEMQALAIQVANEYAMQNPVLGTTAGLASDDDVEFGKAVYDPVTMRFVFDPGGEPTDAVRVTVRRPSGDTGPIPFAFARVFGFSTRALQARAAAVLIPRDIAVAIDLSASMNDDSELRHYKAYYGELGDWRPGVQINLRDIWCALDGPEPERPYFPGSETETEYASDSGPPIGAMTEWGSEVVPESYDPATDTGLWYIPKYYNCTEAAAQASLAARGYSAAEISALMSGAADGSYGNQWRNRTGVTLGLANWHSGKAGGWDPAGGNGNDTLADSEVTWEPKPTFRVSWSWSNYIDYVRSTSTQLYRTNSSFRYRYGLKTFTNWLLEQEPGYSQTNNLWQTPQQPLRAVKDAVQAMTDVIVSLESLDQMSLEIFATTVRHEVDLTDAYQSVADSLYEMQAGHYDTCSDVGGGLAQAITELNSSRARPAAAKVIVLMSDGKPNISAEGYYRANGDPEVRQFCLDQAQEAADQGMRIYTISVGYDVDQEIMAEIATVGRGQHFHAEGTPEEYSEQLDAIFRTLGGKRPVALIE
jgi:Flp pilus assembly protein TadG